MKQDVVEGKSKIKKHLAITCFAYMYFGVGMAVQQLGIQAGIGLVPCLVIFISSVVFFAIAVFTSMEKIKEKLFDEPNSLKQ